MPIFKNRKTINLPGGAEISIGLEAGLMRGGSPDGRALSRGAKSGIASSGAERLRRAKRRIAGKGRELALEKNLPYLGSIGERGGGLDPAKMIWIFGSGRSGSTWLRSMMNELENHWVWEEPMAGKLFGDFYDKAQQGQLSSANFIMGGPTRKGWIRSIRSFVLDGARYAHPLLSPDKYLVIKEPNGSVGAPLLMEALPESCMVLLIRDPRDVVASSLDAAREGSWMYESKTGAWKDNSVADKNPDRFVRTRSQTYLRDAGGAVQAYGEHEGPKTLVRYEDLVSDTLGTMSRIYEDLGIEVDEQELGRAVEKHSWENIPEEKKGEGKFYRKGQPGGWREDLTEEQVGIVEEITGSLLKEFYTDEQYPEFARGKITVEREFRNWQHTNRS